MKEKGHEIRISAREKDVTLELLETYGLPYKNRGKLHGLVMGKAVDMVRINHKIHTIAKEFNPHIMMGVHNPYIAQVGWLLDKDVFIFTDTEHSRIANYLTFPFATKIITPECFGLNLGKKQIKYNGYHELAYLHPNHYKPDPSVLDLLSIQKDEKYVVMRFVSGKAFHDIGHKGLSPETKKKAVEIFSQDSKVFVSSEDPLPKELEKYRLRISPEKIHDVLYYASLYFGEGATMASECAVLGTPAIYVSDLNLGYINDEEKTSNIVFNFSTTLNNQERALKKGVEILRFSDPNTEWRESREKILTNKIDVTAFMIDFVESYCKVREVFTASANGS